MTVSVLLTCYNHLEYLPAAYESILAQSFGDFEILALDDGSSDGSREWLESQSDPRLRRIFNAANLGTYGSLNVGLEQAKGELVAVLNDDDVWMPSKLERQVATMASNPAVVLSHTGGRFIDSNGEPLADPAPLGFPFPTGPSGKILEELVYRNQIIISSAMFRREAARSVGSFDPGFYGCGDWHLWLRLAKVGETEFEPGDLTLYRVHGSNATHNRTKMLEDDRRVREWISAWEADYPDLKRAFAHNWAALGAERSLLGDRSGAREAYRRSLALAPKRWKSRLRLWSTYLPAK